MTIPLARSPRTHEADPPPLPPTADESGAPPRCAASRSTGDPTGPEETVAAAPEEDSRDPSRPAILAAAGVDRHEAERVGASVLEAIGDVRDPELDEPLVELGFVGAIAVDRERITIRLRLPTYFCAANFTYLMAADTRVAAMSAAGRRAVTVTLEDHFVDAEVSDGVNSGQSFSETFRRLADDDLSDLRRHFSLKAHSVRQWEVAAALVRRGWSEPELATAQLRDAPPGPATERLHALRRALGFDLEPTSPLLLGPEGRGLSGDEVAVALDLGRLSAVSLSTNATLCRGLLGVRYGITEVSA